VETRVGTGRQEPDILVISGAGRVVVSVTATLLVLGSRGAVVSGPGHISFWFSSGHLWHETDCPTISGLNCVKRKKSQLFACRLFYCFLSSNAKELDLEKAAKKTHVLEGEQRTKEGQGY
jgi:hypothetical protein